jgi:hypothetical protein
MGNIKAKTHLEKLGFSDTDKKNPNHDNIQEWVYNNIDLVIKETVMKDNEFPYKIIDNKWEHQVEYKNRDYKTIVGFIDILVKIEGIFIFKHSNELITEHNRNVYIEIKTTVPSLGELIRQMRAYQSYTDIKSSSYVVVSPDDRHTKILTEQGFYFYKYKDPSLLF